MSAALEAIYRDLLRRVDAGRLMAKAWEDPTPVVGRIHVLGAGKASAAMAAYLVSRLPVCGGLVVSKEAFTGSLGPVEQVLGDHPVPGERSLAAGDAMLRYVQRIDSEDLTLFCLSGGASALLEALPPGVDLEDLREVTSGLLRAGVPIEALNTVRRRLSRLKGGGLGARIPGAVRVYVLSDVLGNDLLAIGSGPFVSGPSGDAETVLRAAGLARYVSLLGPEPKEGVTPPHRLIGDAETLRSAAKEAIGAAGLEPLVHQEPIVGEARALGERIARESASLRRGQVGVWVGEPTVTVRGAGRGGRAQELALAAAIALPDGSPFALLAAGTDGSDGPTDAAGACVTWATVAGRREEAAAALEDNDSYRFLDSAGALLRTGPTDSNLGDVVLVSGGA